MNKKIFNSFLTACIALALTSCGENTWNDHYLDGFEGGADYDTPSSTEGTYTLTNEDYAAISKLLQEEATTDAETEAAKAIGTNLYFDKTGIYPATVALPYFMKTSTFPYYLDANGSNVAMTYAEVEEVAPEITSIAGAYTYTLSANDYTQVPSDNVAAGIPSILDSKFNEAVDGDYAIVSYCNSMDDDAASTTTAKSKSKSAAGRAGSNFELSNVLGSLIKGNDIAINGYVAAISTQGPIVTDAAGSVFVYKPTNNNDLKIGDQLSINSTVDAYNYGFQIKSGSTPEIKGTQTVTYPSPKAWTGAEIDKFVNDAMASGANPITPVYSTFKGKATISGNYINIKLDGTEKQLSPYGVTDELKAAFVDGMDVIVEGYVIAIASKGKYLNTVVTKATTIVPDVNPDTNAVYYFDKDKWVVASNVVALNPADYESMGFENDKLEDAASYIPMYLKNKYPYAQIGDKEFVVYNGSKCDMFVFDGTAWTLNNNGLETVTARYTRKSGSWTFVKYLGKAVFHIYNEEKLELDRGYLFVYGDQCATPVAAGKTYGYLTAVTVPVKNGEITLQSDAYAFTLTSSYTDEETGETIKTPDGTFLFQDSYGRYLYLSGGYNSPNLTNAPVINDNKIDETYLFTAKNNGDGTWSIVRGDRTMHLSTNYGSYGFYQPSGTSDKEVLPSLYLLE